MKYNVMFVSFFLLISLLLSSSFLSHMKLQAEAQTPSTDDSLFIPSITSQLTPTASTGQNTVAAASPVSIINPGNIESGEFGANVGGVQYTFPPNSRVGINSLDPEVAFYIGSGTRAGSAPKGRNFLSVLDGGEALALNGVFVVNQKTASPQYGPQAIEGYTVNTHPSGNVHIALATIGNLENAGSGNINIARATTGHTFVSKDGTIQTASGLEGTVSLLSGSTGSIMDARGLDVDVKDGGSGVIKVGYGVYIGEIAADLDFGVYQADSGADNYFAGNMGIGTASPSEKLEVRGGVRLNTSDARPKCNDSRRGTVWFMRATTSTTADKLVVCIKTGSTSDAYAWVPITP